MLKIGVATVKLYFLIITDNLSESETNRGFNLALVNIHHHSVVDTTEQQKEVTC